jgi:DNA-directed RNA polymerase specialized sigma24 family protein
MRAGHRFRELDRVGHEGEGKVALALDKLDGEARLVLALLFVEGLSEAEAAAALDRSVEHVRKLALAAQRALAASASASASTTGAVVRRAA